MPEEDISQPVVPPSEPAPVVPVIPSAPVEPTVPSESVAPPPDATIQAEPTSEVPTEKVDQIESDLIAPTVPDASVPIAQSSSPVANDSTPVLPPMSDSDLPTIKRPESIPTVNQPEPITISSTSSIPPQAAPQATVPQSLSAWNPHSAEEINYLKTVLGPKAWASHRIHMQANIDKVMELARKKGTIDRTDVRLHLEVSQATATRYLTELVHEGKLARKHVLNDNVYKVR